MKITTLLFLLFTGFISFSQEMADDLFLTLKSSSLHIFKSSEKSKMTIRTYRKSPKHGVVEETTSNYRKGKINIEKINFNIHYTEFYLIEDRKKSLGKYFFNEKNEILKYERTDFDNRNQRSVTFYNTYYYTNSIVNAERIRIKEYIGQGSAELDTVVYLDSVIYEVLDDGDNYRQENLSDPGVYILYVLDEERLISKTVHFDGFEETETYTYDSKGHLVRINNELKSDEGNSVKTKTEIHYSIDGLITETIFYDEKNELLERKIFTYK